MSRPRCTFFDLPQPLRDFIYQDVANLSKVIDIRSDGKPNITAVNEHITSAAHPHAFAQTCKPIQAEYAAAVKTLLPPTLTLILPIFDLKLSRPVRRRMLDDLRVIWRALLPSTKLVSNENIDIKILLGQFHEDACHLLVFEELYTSWYAFVRHTSWRARFRLKCCFDVVLRDGRVARYSFTNHSREKLEESLRPSVGVLENGSLVGQDDEEVVVPVKVVDIVGAIPEFFLN